MSLIDRINQKRKDETFKKNTSTVEQEAQERTETLLEEIYTLTKKINAKIEAYRQEGSNQNGNIDK